MRQSIEGRTCETESSKFICEDHTLFETVQLFQDIDVQYYVRITDLSGNQRWEPRTTKDARGIMDYCWN